MFVTPAQWVKNRLICQKQKSICTFATSQHVVKSFWQGAEFKIKGREYIFHFVDNGLIAYRTDGSVLPYENCLAHFLWLINGEEEIVKMPWKPRKGDDYYTFSFGCSFGCLSEEWVVVKQQWDAHPYERALLDRGWVYRTEEEAKAALPSVAKELGVEYKL